MFEDELSHVPMEGVENYVVSNTECNRVYVDNMSAMGNCGNNPTGSAMDWEDSDTGEPIDISEALREKVSAIVGFTVKLRQTPIDRVMLTECRARNQVANPTWDELNPALQVEIVENMLKTNNWKSTYRKLRLNADARHKIRSFLNTRNKQIRRENKLLAHMRESQLRTLMRIDNSDVKRNKVPHQLVLRKFTKKTTRKLLESEYTDLLMCQAADVLAARQYLHQLGLPRELAGDWGHSLVVLREPNKQGQPGREEYEWDEDLCFDKELSYQRNISGVGNETSTELKSDFIQNISKGSTTSREMLLDKNGDESVPNGNRYFSAFDPETNPAAESYDDGFIRVGVGVEKAAQIQPYQEGKSPTLFSEIQSEPPLTISPLLLLKQPASGADTPSKMPAAPRANINMSAISPSRIFSPSVEHIIRSLDGHWSPATIDPAIAHARYKRQIEQARREGEQRKREIRLERSRQKVAQMGKNERRSQVESAATWMPPTSTVDNVPNGMFLNDPTLPALDEFLAPAPYTSHEELGQFNMEEMWAEFLVLEENEEEQHQEVAGDDVSSCDECWDEKEDVVLVPMTDEVSQRTVKRTLL